MVLLILLKLTVLTVSPFSTGAQRYSLLWGKRCFWEKMGKGETPTSFPHFLQLFSSLEDKAGISAAEVTKVACKHT